MSDAHVSFQTKTEQFFLIEFPYLWNDKSQFFWKKIKQITASIKKLSENWFRNKLKRIII